MKAGLLDLVDHAVASGWSVRRACTLPGLDHLLCCGSRPRMERPGTTRSGLTLYSDAVTRGWVRGEHEDARRLVAHADRQYETRVRVSTSARAWAERSPASIAGTPGHLWHVDFFKRGQGIDVPALWRDVEGSDVGRLLLHLEAHGAHHVGFTFSAVDDDTEVADAVGSAFDYVLMNLAYGHEVDHGVAWSRRMRDMDYRIVSGDGWTVVDETTVPISNFGAGGGVTRRPRG